MTSEVKYAPRHVIDELNRWTEDEDTEHCVGSLLDDISLANISIFGSDYFSKGTAQWVYKSFRIPSDDLPYEQAVIEHVFGDTRLEVEDGK